MTPERWQQIEPLYHAARALPPGDRSAYLATACSDDEGLLREVESLLSQPPSNEGLLAGHARDVAGIASHPPAMTGRTLGGYEMQSLIGVGGMGEVYRARDLKLGREVAVKVLPFAFTSDPGRLARFDREARMLAALNHPNICAIHGFEHAGDIRFLVLELVGGETLAERLDGARARTGGLGLPDLDALSIARQIARALDFAHSRGIVHRDLKPANIKITPDGAVKVLDFGLAKATAGDASGVDLEAAPNVTHNGTIEGSLLGTPAYMSPEQARGRPIDKRTDIWAFGCVLYEMLTGRAAFAGDTMADTIARVIEREPDWSALPRSTPEPIRQLLFACLVKDSQARLQDIGDVTIESILSGSASGTTRAPAVRRVKRPMVWLKWATVAAALAAGIAWGVWPAPKVVERTLDLPAGQLLDDGARAHVVRISRDASQLAYVGLPGLLYIWPGTQGFKGVSDIEFSPDGKAVAFYSFADHALMRMPVGGGAYVKISSADTPTGIHWGRDGTVLFGQGEKGIWRASVNAQGAEQIARVRSGEHADGPWLVAGEEAHGPWLLPDNDHYLFTIAKGRAFDRWDSAQIVVQSLKTGLRTELSITGSDVRYLPTLHLLIYAVGGRLWAIRFDPDTLTTQGNAVPVLDGVSRATGSFTGAANFSISDDGTLAYVKGPVDATPPLLDIAIVEDPTGKAKPRKLNAESDRYESVRVSPDGSQMAAGVEAHKEKAATIYTIATNGGTPRQLLTFQDSDYRFPAWTHDSRRIAYQSYRHRGIWWQAADRTDKPTRLTWADAGEEHIPESWSPDGTLLYSITTNGTARLWTLPVRNRRATTTSSMGGAIDPAAGEPQRFGTKTSSGPMSAMFSPDSRAVAYTRTDRGETTVCVELFPSQGSWCLSPGFGESPRHPRWSADGKRLYYSPRPAELESVEVVLGRDVQFGRRQKVAYQPILLGPPAYRTPYDINKDGQLVGLIPMGQDEFRLIPAKAIVVVSNWFETLKQKLK